MPGPLLPAAVGVVAEPARARALVAALERAGVAVAGVSADAAALATLAPVVVVAGPVGCRVAAARAALARGAHVALAWPPGPSPSEAAALGPLAEEAGAEVAVEPPFAWGALPVVSPRLVVLALATPALDRRALAGALGTAACLAGGPRLDAARLDAAAEREAGTLRAAAVWLRFPSDVAVVATLRAGSPGVELRVDGGAPLVPLDPADALAREAAALVGAGRAASPLYAALATLRLSERVRAVLR